MHVGTPNLKIEDYIPILEALQGSFRVWDNSREQKRVSLRVIGCYYVARGLDKCHCKPKLYQYLNMFYLVKNSIYSKSKKFTPKNGPACNHPNMELASVIFKTKENRKKTILESTIIVLSQGNDRTDNIFGIANSTATTNSFTPRPPQTQKILGTFGRSEESRSTKL